MIEAVPSEPDVIPVPAGRRAAGCWVGVRAILAPIAVGTALAAALILGAHAARPSRSPASADDALVLPDVPTRVLRFAVDVDSGHALYMANCSSCHGGGGEGMPMQGADLRRSYFVQTRSNEQLMAFLLLGRQPGDRYTVLGRAMPARGGNPLLDEADLADIVAYLRRLQVDAAAASAAAVTARASEPPVAATPAVVLTGR